MSINLCAHVQDLPPAEPSPLTPRGCAECIAIDQGWVHLRLCLTCGHVGCCDSSPGRHATEHYRETGHPVIRSYQPGEAWQWCYLDEVIM